MKPVRNLFSFLLLIAFVCATASAHYHFVHYPSRTSPFVPVFEKFDLSALIDRTLFYYVSEEGPSEFAPGDSFASVLSQIRLAVESWNQVPTSELKVAFGGLYSVDTSRTTPSIDLVFEELPGVLAAGAPVTRGEVTAGSQGDFVPITRSVVILPRDLSSRHSSSEGFFLTLVHEFGHALGLQHTLTSSVMSTDFTRATTRSKPITADDMAALSILYPAPHFASVTGSISGRVHLASGEGVPLASVVALRSYGEALSTLTHPDGTYKIEGVPPGQYRVYVHPLPPSNQSDLGPAEIVLPLDPDKQPFSAGEPFATQFYPGTKNPNQAFMVPVAAGAETPEINFEVQPRGPVQIYGVHTYSFPGWVAVKPAFVNKNVGEPWMVAASSGAGLTSDGAPAQGLNVSVLGGSPLIAQASAYAPDTRYLQLNLLFNPFAGTGPRHLVFSFDDDIYVLPSGLNVVGAQPPYIGNVFPEEDGTGVVLEGPNLREGTQILFDGVAANIRSASEGRVVVVPPPAPSGHTASLIALNSDGQSSVFLQDGSLPAYTYGESDPPVITFEPSALPAGSESMVEITGVNAEFNGTTQIGFGTSDIVVRRIWTLGPERILANVWVAPETTVTAAAATVVTGLKVFSQRDAFEILPAEPDRPTVDWHLRDSQTGRESVYPGGVAILSGTNFAADAGQLEVTLNGETAFIHAIEEGNVAFQIPPEMPLGPAILRLRSGENWSYPVVISIDPPPPVIEDVMSGSAISDNSRVFHEGEILRLIVSRLADPTEIVALNRIRVSVDGIEHIPHLVKYSEERGGFLMEIRLSPFLATNEEALVLLSIDGRLSLPFRLSIQGK